MKHFACAFALVWSYHVVRADEPPPQPAAESASHEQRSADWKTLDEKLGELRALQAEVDQLRQRTHQASSILFEIRIAEVSRAKLAAAQPGEAPSGSLLERLTADDDTHGGAKGILSEPAKKLLEKLRLQGALKIVSEPSISTIAERPASMHVGGEVAMPVGDGSLDSRVKCLRYGTSIDIVPVVLDDQRLRLELRLQLSQLDFTNSVEIGGKTYPGLVSRSIDFAAEVPVGQTVAVVLPPETRQARPVEGKAAVGEATSANGEVETLVLVTPHWVDTMQSRDDTDSSRFGVPVPRASSRPDPSHVDGPARRPRR
ncbi:MAG TPA: hypothetical protein VJ783_21050 [Pirellulales bacterium]|nr:hypothetical protein [Pirellulales bacterium]